jgi:hypothetical protein
MCCVLGLVIEIEEPHNLISTGVVECLIGGALVK